MRKTVICYVVATIAYWAVIGVLWHRRSVREADQDKFIQNLTALDYTPTGGSGTFVFIPYNMKPTSVISPSASGTIECYKDEKLNHFICMSSSGDTLDVSAELEQMHTLRVIRRR